jgi:hypothetical protein
VLALLGWTRRKNIARPSVEATRSVSFVGKCRSIGVRSIGGATWIRTKYFACRASTAGRAKTKMCTLECDGREGLSTGQLIKLVCRRIADNACGLVAMERAKMKDARNPSVRTDEVPFGECVLGPNGGIPRLWTEIGDRREIDGKETAPEQTRPPGGGGLRGQSRPTRYSMISSKCVIARPIIEDSILSSSAFLRQQVATRSWRGRWRSRTATSEVHPFSKRRSRRREVIFQVAEGAGVEPGRSRATRFSGPVSAPRRPHLPGAVLATGIEPAVAH